MKRTLRRLLIFLLIAGAAGAAVWYLKRPTPIAVTLHAVERGLVESTVANTRAGTVDACRRARLAPPLGGQIAVLPVREGDEVTTGQVLLELWNDDLRAEVLLAQRDANAARARAEEACTVAEVAGREAARLTQLHRQGLAAEEAADKAEGDAKARQAACRAARAGAQVNDARIAVAEAALERTILRAPFDGTVAEVNGEVGEFVTPSPVGIPTLPAVDLIDNRCLYVTAPIDEVDAPAIRPGMPARISLDALPGRHFPATVRRVAPYVLDREKQARTVDVEADFLNSEDATGLLAGYSADLEIVLDAHPNVLRVPTEAVLDGNRVLVYHPADGLLEERDIEAGLSNWDHTEVISGLQEGERVVTSVDREGVKAGALVTPENAKTGKP